MKRKPMCLLLWAQKIKKEVSYLFIRKGITIFSVSERVCVLKEAARMLCENK